jgi:KaiC/GvpD/RAD55 family RecA-like ATPase
MEMFGIKGMEQVILSDVPTGQTVILEGDTGVLKTSLAIECVKDLLEKDPGRVSIYFSFKEDPEFLKRRFDLDGLTESGRLLIYDFNRLMEEGESRDCEGGDPLSHMLGLAKKIQDKQGSSLRLLVVDPMSMLLFRLKEERARRFIYHLFSGLADLKIQSIIICEKGEGQEGKDYIIPCRFLADGIIRMGTHENGDDVMRYLEVVKMRGVHHNLNRFQLYYRKGIMKVLGPMYSDGH